MKHIIFSFIICLFSSLTLSAQTENKSKWEAAVNLKSLFVKGTVNQYYVRLNTKKEDISLRFSFLPNLSLKKKSDLYFEHRLSGSIYAMAGVEKHCYTDHKMDVYIFGQLGDKLSINNIDYINILIPGLVQITEEKRVPYLTNQILLSPGIGFKYALTSKLSVNFESQLDVSKSFNRRGYLLLNTIENGQTHGYLTGTMLSNLPAAAISSNLTAFLGLSFNF
ncbi:hypothetical protein GVN16_19095 [Emticicia sp. CRIBPO]|uniref:hypothetical protein n=1 Tax=Emticicia sp. CRIBPO TaxID=2683258 RepID=UPI001412900E|nr:hypothetical protein [Emticicia sp. CRIBPO]NBA87884.1 hypothetical protein [Emticicia sp. CRIBPO]